MWKSAYVGVYQLLHEIYLRVGGYQHENEYPEEVQVKINYMEDYKSSYKFSIITCML